MSVPAVFPPAEQRMLGMAPGSWSGLGEWKIVWHTTETSGLPDYDPDDDDITGEYAPHLTYWPARRKWIQDYPLTRPAEAVRSFDDDQIFQVEIICYSNKPIADASPSRLWVGDLTDIHYQDLASFPVWLNQYITVPPVWPNKQAYSYSQAAAAGFRYTTQAFRDFGGHLGHQHTPSPNTHWDPGAFGWDKLMSAIGAAMDGPNGEPNWEKVSSWARNGWSWAWAEGLLSSDDPDTPQDESSDPKGIITKEQLMVHLKRLSG